MDCNKKYWFILQTLASFHSYIRVLQICIYEMLVQFSNSALPLFYELDVPKPGCGNINGGNRSRRIFADPELAGAITGTDVNLIYRFKVTLEFISSGHKINTENYYNMLLILQKCMSDYIRGIQGHQPCTRY